MEIDISETYDAMVTITASAASVEQGINALLDYCAQTGPSPIWEPLRALDFTRDVAGLRDWLARVLTQEPPPSSIKTFWFGLYNPVIDEEASCALYVSGSVEEYDPDSLDWACWTEESYLPEGRYADSEVLKTLYQTAAREQDGEFLLPAEYALCLGYACLVVPPILQALDLNLLGGLEECAVAVGFDEGDDVLLGVISKAGWIPNIS